MSTISSSEKSTIRYCANSRRPSVSTVKRTAPSTEPVIEPRPPSTIMMMISMRLEERERVRVEVHEVVGEQPARDAGEAPSDTTNARTL